MMEILYFPNFPPFFSDPHFYATVKNFRLLDYVMLLHATVLGMRLGCIRNNSENGNTNGNCDLFCVPVPVLATGEYALQNWR